MFSVYFWCLLSMFVLNGAKIYLESEFFDSWIADILQWVVSFILTLIFFSQILTLVPFLPALLHLSLWSILLMGITFLVPKVTEEYLGYGDAEDIGLGPWFLAVSLGIGLLWGGFPLLVNLPGFRAIWRQLPFVFILFLLLHLLLNAFKVFLQEHFEQALLGNCLGAFLSLLLTLAFCFGLQEKLEGQSLLLASVALSLCALAIWILFPFATENLYEWGHCDSQTVKLGILQFFLVLLIMVFAETFSFLDTVSQSFQGWLDYVNFWS